MNDLEELLDELPVPEHGPQFWDDLAARLGDEATPIDVGPPGPGYRRSRVIVVVSVAAAILLVVVFGRQILNDEDGSAPVITDVTTSTTEPEPENGAPVPGGIDGLSWTFADAPPATGLDEGGVSNVAWYGTRWILTNTAVSGLSSVEGSADGVTWEPLPLPDGFRPADARGHGASMVSWGATGTITSGLDPAAVAVSTDAGASWDLLATNFEALDPPRAEFFRVSHPILGSAVRDDTVLVAVAPSSGFSADGAVAAAGIPPMLQLRTPGAQAIRTTRTVWGNDDPADDLVEITEFHIEAPSQTMTVSFEELGVDRGAHRPRLPIRLLRSTDGGPLLDVTVDLGFDVVKDSVQDASTTPETTLDLGVLNGGFYIVRQQGESAEVLSSPDGLTWQAHDFEGAPDTIAATNDALFALRGGEVIRSDDIGGTWIVVPTGRGVSQLAAGPSGVLLIDDSADSSIAWSTNGRDFSWVSLRDAVPFEVDDAIDESVTLAEAVVGDGQILVSIGRVRTDANGERRAIQSPHYVLKVD